MRPHLCSFSLLGDCAPQHSPYEASLDAALLLSLPGTPCSTPYDPPCRRQPWILSGVPSTRAVDPSRPCVTWCACSRSGSGGNGWSARRLPVRASERPSYICTPSSQALGAALACHGTTACRACDHASLPSFHALHRWPAAGAKIVHLPASRSTQTCDVVLNGIAAVQELYASWPVARVLVL